MLDQYHSDQLIGTIHVPVLIVHGTHDGVIRFQFAETLFALANEPKTFIAVPGAGHLVLVRPDVWPRVLHWLDAQLKPQPISANSP